jgi:hypothetical protein
METTTSAPILTPTLAAKADTHYWRLLHASTALTDKEIQHLADSDPGKLTLLGQQLQEVGKRLQNAID